MPKIVVPFSTNLLAAIFVDRPNRFIVRCQLSDAPGELVEAHLADPGRLRELLLPGKKMYLQQSDNPNRKTKYSAVMVEREDGAGWVSINSILPNKLAELAIKQRIFPELSGWEYVRAEFTKGKSRWDFLLSHADGRRMVIEVKGASLVKEQIAYFPDAVTTRGAKHVRELADIVNEEGWEAAVLFVVQRSDVMQVKPAEHIDPGFAAAMREAHAAGVLFLGCRCNVAPAAVEIIDQIQVPGP
nr:DNA/RNA nuclease SfsA [Evansella caseinilytica]